MKLKDKMLALQAANEKIEALASSENRELSKEEMSTIQSNFEKFEDLEKQIEIQNKIEANKAKLSASTGSIEQKTSSIIVGEDLAKKNPKNKVSFADIARAEYNAKTGAGLKVSAAATTYINESVGEEGGFAVPTDFREELMTRINSENSLTSYVSKFPTSTNNLAVPQYPSAPWDENALKVYYTDEGEAVNPQQLKLKMKHVRLKKMSILVPVSKEFMQDAAFFQSWLSKAVNDSFIEHFNDQIINGDGRGAMQGIINDANGNLVTVAKESGQTAGTIVFNNIAKMRARTTPGFNNGIWITTKNARTQLEIMSAPGNQFPAYMPEGGLSARPYDTLYGQPIILDESCQKLGNKGDIIHADLSKYMLLTKSDAGTNQIGIDATTSMDFYFDQALAAFRFDVRAYGAPIWDSLITAKNDPSVTYGDTVVLAERA